MRYRYVIAIIGVCVIVCSPLHGSAIQNGEAQGDNASCLCCECKGILLTKTKHPYSFGEVQAAACLLALPFGYNHSHNNQQSFPLLELVLAYWGGDDAWLVMHPLTAISDIKISANIDAPGNATAYIPYVMGKPLNKGPLAKYGVIVDLTIAECYQEPLINKQVQFTADDIKKLQNALKILPANKTDCVEVTSLCRRYKVCIQPKGIGTTRIKRTIRLDHMQRMQELWSNPTLLAALLTQQERQKQQTMRRCVIS